MGDTLPGVLKHRSGRTLPDLKYKVFYYGRAWEKQEGSPLNNPHAEARENIDRFVALAMNDCELNKVLAQYFDGQKITGEALTSEIIYDDERGLPPNVPFNENDIRRIIRKIAGSNKVPELATTAINIVLPQGMSLEILGLDEQERQAGTTVEHGVPRDTPNYSSGIAGYHGSVVVDAVGTEVLYSVVAWSDGSIGIPIPGWEGWENVAAILYHELQEIRTNPDVDRAVRSGESRHIGWNTDPMDGPDEIDCREIADLPLIVSGREPQRAFSRVEVECPDGTKAQVPIQAIWSNHHGRMLPDHKPSPP